jgi:UDP-N-acetylglucosamine 4-epimerase
LPKVEDRIGTPLSPYGLTKWVNELYSQIFESCYGFWSIGLRYFNVYGPRQDPNGAYAALILKWIDAMLQGRAITIHGDGQTSRDFCFVANAVQANILAALRGASSPHRVYNVAVGGRTSLNELFDYLAERLSSRGFPVDRDRLRYGPFRRGDVAHSQADISRIEDHLGLTVAWFVQTHKRRV